MHDVAAGARLSQLSGALYPVSMNLMRIDGPTFKDEFGRTLLLRGVNLGGSTKVPASPNGATHLREQFLDHRNVSFVGRPFALAEADEHFARLKRWGLTFLRFLVTWEAVEHAGPGQYDQAYLEYLEAVVRKAGEHGLKLFIDPHQDVWSRFSGGDGAPGWTLEAAGFELGRLNDSAAAIVHAFHGDPFPRMIWPTNATKLACATMFTLFFGGDDFAPDTTVSGESIQAFLQRHYIDAMVQVARRLRGIDCVTGYDTLNEPVAGWIGWPDITKTGGRLRLGDTPSPLQAMAMGAGVPQAIEWWKLGVLGLRSYGKNLRNRGGVKAWRDENECVWRANGVWDTDERGQPVARRRDHFANVRGRPVHFENDYFKPFAHKYLQAIRAVDDRALLFLETEATQRPPEWRDAPRVVFAPHWYDGVLLFSKKFFPWAAGDFRGDKPVFGRRRIERSFADQLHTLQEYAKEMGTAPTLLGEFGIPFDMDGRKAFETGNYHRQALALDRTYQALDANLMHGTLWNYTADNTHDRGDQWNGEDLSIFSRDDLRDPADPDAGGRALDAVVRPYPMATAGEPLEMHYDMAGKRFTYRFRAHAQLPAPTEIYLPSRTFGPHFQITCTSGTFERDLAGQRLIHRAASDGEVTITVRP